jgi:hypothetical protein
MLRQIIIASALASALAQSEGSAEAPPSTSASTTYHRAKVDGIDIFYRQPPV